MHEVTTNGLQIKLCESFEQAQLVAATMLELGLDNLAINGQPFPPRRSSGFSVSAWTSPRTEEHEVQDEPGMLDTLPSPLPPSPGVYPYRGVDHRFPLSSYQQRVVDFLLDGKGDCVVNAVAGSGKTSTLKAIARYLTKPALFLAFNRHIAVELKEALEGTHAEVATIHSIGFRALRKKLGGKLEVVESKYHIMAKWLVERAIEGMPVGNWKPSGPYTAEMMREEYPVRVVRELARLMRVELRPWKGKVLDFEQDLLPLCLKYDVDVLDHPDMESFVAHAVSLLLVNGVNLADTKSKSVPRDLASMFSVNLAKAGVIDYTDMIWLPSQVGAVPWQFGITLVDEAQDLSPAQLSVAMSCRYRNGRMIFVGDRRQAIYGFAGAAVDSIDQIVQATDAVELPLSICYRCPSSHLDLARDIVPEIEAAPWADEGLVGSVKDTKLHQEVREGDIITCRTTAPLIAMCFGLLKQGISAKVRGRDIGAQILSVLDELEKRPDFSFQEIEARLWNWSVQRTSKILKRNGGDEDDPAIQAIKDRADAIVAFLEMSEAETMDDLRSSIESLFSDERSSVWLATVHRVKGLEADRVFLLKPELLPFPFAKQDWQREQEQNLYYVALTRAKSELYFVVEDKGN